GRGESPSAVQLGSCEEIWASARQKVLEEETILRSGVQSWDFRSFQYLEAEGPRGLRNRFHQLYHKWLQPERNTKAQMLDLVVLKYFLTLLPPEMKSWTPCYSRSFSAISFLGFNHRVSTIPVW
uniref:SCAN box domain-containing protein n=1 Tax=Pseudonaja textilis TaxID=8673 RepID=A0A670ZAT4_PSETE